jgi:Leucine-rich repeat (LRR) protein
MSNSVVILGKSYNISTTTVLDLSGQGLTELPEGTGRLTNIKRLYLSENELSSVPDWIGRLTNLKILHLDGNKLTSLPDSFGRLTKLTQVYLGRNELRSLPDSFGNLTELDTLDLQNNKLTSLPENFGRLTKLYMLFLSGNNITSLPASFKNLDRNIMIAYNHERNNDAFSRDKFIKLFRPTRPTPMRRVSKNTELFNRTISETKKLSNIPKNKRVYINTNTNVKNNVELRRLYNKNGINQYMRGRTRGRLHGGNFTRRNVRNLKNTNVVNKNVYLRNIKVRLQNSPLNNLQNTVNTIKTNLPSNVSRNDVNTVVRNMKPYIINKIYNKLKNAPSNNRLRLMNAMKNRGLMNNSDIDGIKRKFGQLHTYKKF